MKSVILFRHAEAAWLADTGRDHDRVLSSNGIETAKKMGQYLSKEKNIPELVISSTAIRAKTTAEIAIKSGRWKSGFQLEGGIYGGDPQYLLNLVQTQQEKIASICFVGHEPNLSNFLVCATENSYKIFPTASMTKIDFNVDNWKNITFGFGTVDWTLLPNKISISRL